MTPLVYQRGIEKPNFRISESLPTLQPVANGELTVKSVDDKLVIECKRDLVLSWPTEHFLVRWWVNGKPFIPSPKANATPLASGQVISGRSLLLGLECDPKRLGAKFGDKIELHRRGTGSAGSASVLILVTRLAQSEAAPLMRQLAGRTISNLQYQFKGNIDVALALPVF